MTEENLHQDSEDQKSTQNTGSESEDAKDLENLFADEEEQKEGETLEQKVERLANDNARLKKGVAKYFSDKGRDKSKAEGTKTEDVNTDTSDLEEMFFEQKPEADLVKADLKQIAKAKGVSIVKAWREEKWLQEKAASLAKAKKEEEKAKSNIDNPSGEIKKGDEDWDKLTDEEVADLPVAEYEKYREWKLKK